MKFIWLAIGIGIGAILFQGELVQLSEALYSIPPTDAWETIGIDNTPFTNTSAQTNVSAINHRDQLFLLTDGSILLNITEYP